MGIDPPPVIPSQACQLEQAVSKVFPFQGWISGQVTAAAGQAFQQESEDWNCEVFGAEGS